MSLRLCLSCVLALAVAMSLPAGAGAVTGPATHAFPVTTIGSSSEATLTFAAQSSPGEMVQSVLLAGAQSASFHVQDDQCTGQSVAGTCAVTVAFAPTFVGSAGATLRVVGAAGTQEVALTATGSVTGASLVVAPAAIDFGDVFPGSVAARPLTVSNTGDVPVSIDSVGVAGDQASAFVVEADGCGGHTLARGDGCSLMVRFVSAIAGPRAAQVHLVLDGAPAIDVAVRASLVQPYALAPIYLPNQTWASFKLSQVSGKHKRIRLQLYTSLSAHVRLTVARKGRVAASLQRDVYPGFTTLRVPRLRTGRYAVKAMGQRMSDVRMAHASVTVTR